LKQFQPHELNGAISLCRIALLGELDPEKPITMRFFNRDGQRDIISRCVAFWRRQQTKQLAREKGDPLRPIGESIEEVVRAAAG
ncbi:MAG TPA: hypothetical protein VF167_08415, partial [Longimicrobiaceae bacterium]